MKSLITIVCAASIAVNAQAATVATSFGSSSIITTTGQTVDGYKVDMTTVPANLVTDSNLTGTNSTLIGLINNDSGNSFSVGRVRFNPSGNTATWNITNVSAASDTTLLFAVIDTDNGESSTITTGGSGLDANRLLSGTGFEAFELTSNDLYTTINYNETTGVLDALTVSGAPIVLWDVSNLSTVSWTPSNNSQQATFISVQGLTPIPEPSSSVLVFLAGLALMRRRRR